MATLTSVKSGDWSDPTVWSTETVPANGDIVTVASGHEVVFNADQSGFTSGLAGLTVNGTLKWKTDTVTYLKMATDVNIGGAGTLQIGSPTDRIQRPPQGSQTRATIKLQGANSRITTPNIYAYGWEERPSRTTLASDASAGATQLVLSNDMALQPGDQILVGAGSVNDYLTETNRGIYTVSSYNPGTKTVTLSSSIGHSRVNGDYVAPYNRTINFETVRNPPVQSYTPGYYRFEGAMIRNSIGWAETQNIPLDDGILADKCTIIGSGVYGGQYGPQSIQNSTFYNSSVYWSQNVIFKDNVFIHRESDFHGFVSYTAGSLFDGCWFQNARAVIFRGDDLGHGFSQHKGCKARNLQSGAYGHFPHRMICYDMDFGSFTPVNRLHYHNRLYNCIASTVTIDYAGITREGALESFNHNQVDGAYRAWYMGGTVQSQSSVVPPGGSRAYQYTLIDSRGLVRRTMNLGWLEPGSSVSVDVWMMKDRTMTYAPRVYLFDSNRDPYPTFGDDGKLVEAQLPAESVNEWKKLHIEYKNTGNRPIPVSLRCEARNSSGFIYEYVEGIDIIKMKEDLEDYQSRLQAAESEIEDLTLDLADCRGMLRGKKGVASVEFIVRRE